MSLLVAGFWDHRLDAAAAEVLADRSGQVRLVANGPVPEDVAGAMETLVGLQQQGLIRHLGVSNATADQVAQARSIAPIVSVQNMYNLANRSDDALIDELAADGVAYIPFFPLGGFSPLQTDALSAVATRLDSTPMSVALAWLLQRSPNVLLIPGTSSTQHLRENVTGAGLELSEDDLRDLDSANRLSVSAEWRAAET